MASTWTIAPWAGPPVPERWSAVEQQAITKSTGAVPQRPCVPGPTVVDAAGVAVLAISAFSEVRPDPAGKGLLSTAELLTPALDGGSWPARGRIAHPGIGWNTYRYEDLDGRLRGEAVADQGARSVWGEWSGAVVRSGDRSWILDDVVRPETDDEGARRERRRFFRRERLGERVLGHRFLAPDGTEAGRLTWTGDRQPERFDRPYEWCFEWAAEPDDDVPDDGVFVAAMASALRFMAHVGSMLSTS